LTISGKTLISLYLLIHDLTTSRNNFQQDVKIKELIKNYDYLTVS